VARHTGKPVLQFVLCFVDIFNIQRMKKQSKNFGFCAVLPPPPNCLFFQLLSQSHSHNWHFFVETLFLTYFVSAPRLYEYKPRIFLTTWETGFLPKKHVTMTSHVRATYLKRCIAVYPIRRCLQWLTNAMRSWAICPIITSKATVMAVAGVKGFWPVYM